MIIFSGGYNLNKSRFFQNFYYIVLYGIIGTVLSFIFLTILSQLVNYLGWIRLSQNFDQPV